MTGPVLLVDTWQYGGAIDEAALLANGVSGILVRLNGTDGYLSLDAGFALQWEQAAALPIRIPYVVYDPSHTPEQNYQWLSAHMPPEAGAVAVDVEVKPPAGKSAASYAADVSKFMAMAGVMWNAFIYTGEWFLSYLSTWPAAPMLYWWANYPYALYPDTPQTITWDQLRAKLAQFARPLNYGKIPGTMLGWQFTADRYFLPGCEKKMDVSVFYTTIEELQRFAAGDSLAPDPTTGEEHSIPFAGVEYGKIFRFNSWCHFLIEPADPDYPQHVTEPAYKTVSQVARDLGAQTAINGSYADSLHVSEGVQYHGQNEYEPWIDFSRLDVAKIGPYNLLQTKWNTLGGKRYIVLNGKQSPNTSPAWSEVHPRTLIGLRADGRVVKCVIDGRQPGYSLGVNFYDAAKIMIELGCVTAIDLDGGGSSAMWVRDRIVNRPIDQGVPGKERAVINHITMKIAGETVPPPPPPTGGNMLGIAKAGTTTNVKNMATGAILATLKGGDYVFGTPNVSPPTDLINFDHIYRADDSRVDLGAVCKCVVQNLVLTEGSEPDTPPAPVGTPFTLTIQGYKPFSGTLEPE